VYIDEIQDLSLSQIALLNYVCQNPEKGFVFCGDTAQAIAKETDFRLEDIKALYYEKFVQGLKRSIEVFELNQNFRTHDGVLNLS
jgi:superfamily I DNA/RNA helicase